MKPNKRIEICSNLDANVVLIGRDNGDGVYFWNLEIDINSDAGSVVHIDMVVEQPFDLKEIGTKLIQAAE